MTQDNEKREPSPPPSSEEEDLARQLKAARSGMEKYKEALRELAKT